MRPLRTTTMLAEVCRYCGGPADENWFDRSVCPEPCDKMHTCCANCGSPLDGCYWVAIAELPVTREAP